MFMLSWWFSGNTGWGDRSNLVIFHRNQKHDRFPPNSALVREISGYFREIKVGEILEFGQIHGSYGLYHTRRSPYIYKPRWWQLKYLDFVHPYKLVEDWANLTIILLMEEILHHQGCLKLCKQWDKLTINWCRISEPSTVFLNSVDP